MTTLHPRPALEIVMTTKVEHGGKEGLSVLSGSSLDLLLPTAEFWEKS